MGGEKKKEREREKKKLKMITKKVKFRSNCPFCTKTKISNGI